MDKEAETNKAGCREWWQNCAAELDAEMRNIDAMEDSIAPLDDETTKMRRLITRFESCYHEADKEAAMIARAIGDGRCPAESSERPAKRKEELENCRRILSCWCENQRITVMNLDIGGLPAKELLSHIGEATPLKIWQVQRIVDKVSSALEPGRPYHNMALDMGDYGEPGANPLTEHYKDSAAFLEQSKTTIIRDTIDGHKAGISLAMAIDLLMPCHWDFAGSVVTILAAIGGDLHPPRPYTCCSRNLKLSPLYDRLRVISNTLSTFWKGGRARESVLASLGAATPVKLWLAASLDKTIRLQLDESCDFWLQLT